MRSKSTLVNPTSVKFIALLLIATLVAGCSSTGKKSMREKDWRPSSHVVKKGDTLYSIAFNYGFDYHELAKLNGIKDPTRITIGQKISLFPGKKQPTSTTRSRIKNQPKVVKYRYTKTAMARIESVQLQTTPYASAAAAQSSADTDDNTVDESAEPALNWTVPTKGRLIGKFSERANRKGIEIAGKLGQPIVAVESGKVVYSGSGLRGYGKLIIIKHNKTYLSAYAHNDKILVKEGQSVKRGQKIAAMGKTDSKIVKLHFEVRRDGKPVDPAKYLPLGKS